MSRHSNHADPPPARTQDANQPDPAFASAIPYADLDPGIRETVRWLAERGFRPTDSGDGRSKQAAAIAAGEDPMGCALDWPNVVMVVEPSQLAAEADRLHRELAAAGAVIAGTIPMTSEEAEEWGCSWTPPPPGAIRGRIEVSYEPRAGGELAPALLLLSDVDDDALRAAGVFERSEPAEPVQPADPPPTRTHDWQWTCPTHGPIEASRVTPAEQHEDCGEAAETVCAACGGGADTEGLGRECSGEEPTHWIADAPAIHIYEHIWPHSDQLVVGTAAGLHALLVAVTGAIARDDGHASADVMASDGEGYSVLVARVDGEALDALHPGYTDETFQHRGPDTAWDALYKAAVEARAAATKEGTTL